MGKLTWYPMMLNPEPWRVGPVSIGRKNGKAYPFFGQDAQLAAYKAAIQEELISQRPVMLNGDIMLKFLFWRNRAEYDSDSGSVVKSSPDATNLQKATEDALQGILFANDRQVRHIESIVVKCGRDTEGRVLIGIGNWNDRDDPFDQVPGDLAAMMYKGMGPKMTSTVDERMSWGNPNAF